MSEVCIRVDCATRDRQLVVDALDVHMWQLGPLAEWLARRGGTVQLFVDGRRVAR
ncbi:MULTISPECIES: hypothetical protein [unclassified Nocardia]|uniref:hypothetical protein n=1 Tax=unclassified Nocardia TaxID=2637762 RepID=UPI00278C0421|nr:MULTISPECIES: hypothetical protein [unclassified Nocardia]